MDTGSADALFRAYRDAAGLHADAQVFAFGDTPTMADELGALVVAGRKRATAGLLSEYQTEGVPLPVAGDHAVIVDGAGRAVCVIRVTEVRVGPLSSVDDAFAWDEGEGDRSRAYWLAEHRAFFGRCATAAGAPMDDAVATVFQRFAVVWPPEIAD